MKIKKLYLKRFGKFTEKTIEAVEGINVIYGFNESGKSTIAFFIKAMMFGLDEGNTRMYEKYLPWDEGSEYGGSMEFEHNGVNYRITRFFYARSESLKLFNTDTGRELVPATRALDEIFPALDKKVYFNSYFCHEGTGRPEASMVGELKKHVSRKLDNQTKEAIVDTEYALQILNDRRRGFSDAELVKQIKELEEVIEKEEGIERKLDEIAALELANRREADELDKKLALVGKPSLFEEEEQEYYRHKERYQVYKKDIETSRLISEQLDKTILVREELESNSGKLERCKEELAAVRGFKKKNQDAAIRTKQEYESTSQLLLSESKSNLFKQTALMIFAVVLLVFGLIMKLESVTPFYYIIVFVGAVAVLIYLCINMIKWQIKKKEDKENLQKLKEDLKDYANEYELYFRAHSSEEELVKRYEECLKEDGRIPEIIDKETELSAQLSGLENELSTRKEELLKFFTRFGMVEDLKDDELMLQEEALVMAKEKRVSTAEELRARISSLNEAMIKMHMQVEAGEENEDSLLKHRDERKALLEKKKEINKKLQGIELAIKMIETLSSEEHESFGKVINQVASGYAAAFTGNQYTSFITDDKLNCRVDYYDRYISVEDLSNGAEDQMNLVLRLSIGDLLLSDYELPLIFDDAFVYYDDERLAGTLMEICNRKEQIFIFTCQSREETILNQLNLEYKPIYL